MLDKQGTDFDKLLEKDKAEQKKPLKVPYKKLNPKFDVEQGALKEQSVILCEKREKFQKRPCCIFSAAVTYCRLTPEI
jgi:hypothetical protein